MNILNNNNSSSIRKKVDDERRKIRRWQKQRFDMVEQTKMADFVTTCPPADIIKWPSMCFKILISKFLSGAILIGSIAVKFPQILNILTSKQATGLSPQAFYTEVSITISTVLYNYRQGYPFLSYGETVMILIQNLILVLLLWKFMNPGPSVKSIVSVIFLFVAVTVVCYVLDEKFLYILPLANLPLLTYSRSLQIYTNLKNKTTGQLSSITTGLTFIGSLARIFTTIQDVGWDLSLIVGYVLSTTLAGTLLFQVIKILN